MVFERRCVRAGVVTLLLAVTACSQDEAESTGAFRATAISTELALDPAVVQRPVPGQWPALAFGGGQYLAVWADHRAALAIYGARITEDGTSLDPLGIPLLGANPQAPIPNDEYQLSVASDGEDFLVVTRIDGQLRGLRVNAAGELLDEDPFVIANPVGPAIPSLIFDGEHYLAVWADGTWPPGPDNFVRWARVTPDGDVLDPEGVPAYAAAYAWLRPSVSFDGNNYLLGWTDFDDDAHPRVIEVGRMTPGGTLLDDPPIQINPANLGVHPRVGPALGFDGTNHVVASVQYQQDELLFRASRVTPDGTLLDPDGLPLYALSTEDTVGRLEVAAGSGHSVVVWSWDVFEDDDAPIMAARIDANGVVSGYPEDTFAPGKAGSVAASPDGALLLWGDGITGVRLDADGTPVGEVSPVETASHQLVQAVESDGQDFFMFWLDDAPGGALYGGRLTATGVALDLEPIEIAEHVWQPVVVFDGVNYILSWNAEGLGPRATRVSPAGELLGGTTALPFYAADAASDGTHALLIGSGGSPQSKLAAVLVDHELEVVSEPLELVHDYLDGNAFDPRVIYDGLRYLVVWHDGTTVFGQPVSTAGTLAGERLVIAHGTNIHPLAIAFGGGMSLVVWQDFELDDVRATRVSADGQVLDPESFLVGEANPLGDGCALAFDGDKFVVAWRTTAPEDQWSTADLYVAEVSTAGEVLSTYPLSTGPQAEGPPFLAGANGHVLAAYSRFEPGAPYDAYRARSRLITSLPAIDLDVQAPKLGVSPVDLAVQAGGPQTPVATSQTWPSPHSASAVHGGFLPAGGASPAASAGGASPAASAHGSSPM